MNEIYICRKEKRNKNIIWMEYAKSNVWNAISYTSKKLKEKFDTRIKEHEKLQKTKRS